MRKKLNERRAISQLDNESRLKAGYKSRIDALIGFTQSSNTKKSVGSFSKPTSPNSPTFWFEGVAKNFFLLRELSTRETLEYIAGFGSPETMNLVVAYYLGGCLSRANELNNIDSALPEVYFSVIVESMLWAGQRIHGIDNEIVLQQRRALRQVLDSGSSSPGKGLDHLWHTLQVSSQERKEFDSTINSFTKIVRSQRSRLSSVMGPDLFVGFLRILFPIEVIESSEMSAYFNVCEFWNCSDLLILCLLIRANRSHQNDLMLLGTARKHIHEQNISLEEGTIELIKRWTDSDKYDSSSGKYWLDDIINKLSNLRFAVKSGVVGDIIDALFVVCEADISCLDWIDWDDVYFTIDSGPRQTGFKMAAVYALMARPSVEKDFPIVRVSIGDGAIISALRSAINSMDQKTLVGLGEALLSLPPSTRQVLTHSLLSANSISALSNMLQHDAPWAKELIGTNSLSYDTKISAFKSDFARVLQNKEILSKKDTDLIIEEEKTRLRIAYLHGRRLQGLVNVKWETHKEQISKAFQTTLISVRKVTRSVGATLKQDNRNTLVSNFADQMAELCLITGAACIKTTISDALRHGQITNRLIRVLDESMKEACSRNIDPREHIREIQVNNVTDEMWLVDYQTYMLGTVKEFNENYLSVDSAVFSNKIRSIFNREVTEYLFNNATPSDAIFDPEIALMETSRMLDELLLSAKEAFSFIIKKFTERLKSEQRSTKKGALINFIKFRELFEINAEKAEKEIGSWISQTKASTETLPFKLNDVVQLCLLDHRSGSGRPLNVTVIASERTSSLGKVDEPSPPLIKGRYFEFFDTVIKNLLLNCFGRSGLGIRTKISIDLVRTAENFELKVSNTILQSKARPLKEEIAEIEHSANSSIHSKASADSNSGFQKIRWAYNLSFGAFPKIKLDVSEHPPFFSVLLTFKVSGVDIYESGHTDN